MLQPIGLLGCRAGYRQVLNTPGATRQPGIMTETKKIALVTGANKGIGRYVAQQLAEAGVTVLAGSRDVARGQSTVDELAGDVRLAVLDVTDAASIAAVAKQIEEDFGRLDILVNNAGISPGVALPSEENLDDLRRTYEVNVFGVVAVTNALLPLLRRSEAPRIVNVSSGLGSFAVMQRVDEAYGEFNAISYQTSKAALNAVTVMYAKELRDTAFKVNAISPGYRGTELGGVKPEDKPGAGDPAEGALSVTRLALLADDGPTGEFHLDTGGLCPW